MRAARAHLPYLAGGALFATAVVAPLPRAVRALLAFVGVVLIIADGVLGLRRPVEESSRKWPALEALSARPRYRRAVSVAFVVIGVVGAGYLWAAAFGDGLHGLQDTAALDRSNSFPDANVVYIAALLAFAAGPFGVVVAGSVRPNRLLHWFAAIGGAGGAVFGISRLLV